MGINKMESLGSSTNTKQMGNTCNNSDEVKKDEQIEQATDHEQQLVETYSLPKEFLQKIVKMEKKCIRFSTWVHAVASIQRDLPKVDFLTALETVKATPGYGRAWTIYFEDGSSVVHMKRYGYTDPVYHEPKPIPATDIKMSIGGGKMMNGFVSSGPQK